MNQKEKLIEILNNMDLLSAPTEHFSGYLADHLLSNGVIVLPCKVGKEFFSITPKGKIMKKVVTSIDVGENCEFVIRSFSCFYFISDIGKTIFFTREDAENVLRSNNHDKK